jgi:hypothetical protein
LTLLDGSTMLSLDASTVAAGGTDVSPGSVIPPGDPPEWALYYVGCTRCDWKKWAARLPKRSEKVPNHPLHKVVIRWSRDGYCPAGPGEVHFREEVPKNALLSALLLPLFVALPFAVQSDRLIVLARSWDRHSATSKLLILAAYFVTAWFFAAVLASQWRNIIRLYEGYPHFSVDRHGHLGTARESAG